MGVCPGKSNWKCNRMLLRDTLRFAYWNQKKVQTGKKIISPYFFHRIRPVFDRKSVVG